LLGLAGALQQQEYSQFAVHAPRARTFAITVFEKLGAANGHVGGALQVNEEPRALSLGTRCIARRDPGELPLLQQGFSINTQLSVQFLERLVKIVVRFNPDLVEAVETVKIVLRMVSSRGLGHKRQGKDREKNCRHGFHGSLS
jgi:hypothetical protein